MTENPYRDLAAQITAQRACLIAVMAIIETLPHPGPGSLRATMEQARLNLRANGSDMSLSILHEIDRLLSDARA